MSKCKFTLTVKGNDIEFDSEEQLNSYLKTNYDILSKGYVIFDTEMSTVLDGQIQTPVEKTVSRLMKMLDKTPSMKTEKFDDNGERVIVSSYTGVTARLKQLAREGYLKMTHHEDSFYVENRLIKLRDALSKGTGPVDLQKGYADIMAQFPANMQLNKMTEEQDKKYKELTEKLLMPGILADQAKNKMLGVLGSNLHRMAEVFFKNKLQELDTSFSIKNFPAGITNLSAEGQQHYLDYLNDVTDYLLETHGKDAKILSEYRVYDPTNKLVGVIDLLVADSNGVLHIYDFKTSYKQPADWHSAKEIEYKHQLAAYAAIMQNNGFKVDGLHILPITMNDINFENQTIPSLSEFPPISPNITPDIRFSINQVIPPTSASFYEATTTDAVSVTENLKKAWGYNLKLKSSYSNVEWFKAHKVKQNALEPGKYTFWNDIQRVPVYSTEETIDANIEKYLQEQAKSSNSEFLRFKQWMNNSIKGTVKLIDYQGRNETGNRTMVNAFEKYTRGGWTLITDDSVLDELGIMMFVNGEHNTVEFVSYTVNNLRSKIKLAVGSSIVGNFTTDEGARSLPDLLDATNGNIELMKVYFYMNENAEQFKKYNIGRVMCYNPYTYSFIDNNHEVLQKNFDYIQKRIGGSNDVSDIQTDDKLKLLHSQFVGILNEPSTDVPLRKSIEKYLTTLGDDQNTTRLNRLLAIQKDIHDILKKDHNIDVVTIFDTPLKKMYGMVSQAITVEQELGLKTVESDVAKHGANSIYGSNPTSLPDSNLRKFVEIIKISMNRVRQRITEFKGENTSVINTYLDSKGYDLARRATIGDVVKAYDSLFEVDGEGKILKELILKNPYDKNSDLNDKDRIFLKYFLKEINLRRFRTTSVESETAQELIASGEWFKLPLLRASSATKGASFSLKSVRNATIESWNKILNTNSLFNKEDEQEVASNSADMFTMFNEFNLHSSPNSRTKLIEEQPIGAFETNLERVLDNFVFSSIRKEEYDKMLPIANAIRTSIAWNAFGVNIKVPNILTYMEKYTKMAVFNEKDIDPELETAFKYIQIIKGITSELNIGFNPMSGFVNTLQGMWGTMSRMVSNKYPDMFNKSEFFWALKTFCKDTAESTKHLTLFQSLNSMYGINNMDINIIADVISKNNGGLLNFKSKWLYWMAYAPDYFNRMLIFTAQMKHDGCFEAHSMEGDKMVYDWAKDSRFSEYVAGNKAHPKYNDQYSLYMAMLGDFNKEGLNLTKGQPLPYAYTAVQRESMKMFADSINGYYDHESKVLYNQTILGVLFFHFKTWITAKKDQWVLKPGYYAIGNYQNVVIDDVPMFLDENGQMTKEDTGVPMKHMQGDFMEGIYYSLQGIGRDWKDANWDVEALWKASTANGARLSNLKLMAFDLSIVLLAVLATNLVDWKDLEKDDASTYALAKAFIRSTNDLSLLNNIATITSSGKSPFASFSYMNDLITGLPQIITGNKKVGKYVFENTGMLRPFAPYVFSSTQ